MASVIPGNGRSNHNLIIGEIITFNKYCFNSTCQQVQNTTQCRGKNVVFRYKKSATDLASFPMMI